MNKSTKTYIAVIEDDTGLRRSLSRLLRAADYHPVTYPSAEAFLSDGKHPVFDCMVVDIQLGQMTGIELMERLATAGEAVPVVYLTAHEDREALMESTLAPFAACLGKSEPGAAVFAAIEQAIGSR